jgi:hypothetical protein
VDWGERQQKADAEEWAKEETDERAIRSEWREAKRSEKAAEFESFCCWGENWVEAAEIDEEIEFAVV